MAYFSKPVFPAHIYITVVCTRSSLTPNKRVTPNCLCCTCTYGTYRVVTVYSILNYVYTLNSFKSMARSPLSSSFLNISWTCRMNYLKQFLLLKEFIYILHDILCWILIWNFRFFIFHKIPTSSKGDRIKFLVLLVWYFNTSIHIQHHWYI